MKIKLGIILLACTLLIGCTDGKSSKKTTGVTTISAPYELLLVADKDWVTNGSGTEIMDLLKSDVAVLPQSEACFRVININPSAFKDQFRGYAEIMFVDVKTEYTEPQLLISRDMYAHPQTILTIQAKDRNTALGFIREKGEAILKTFINAELNRETIYLKKTFSQKVMDQAVKQFGRKIYAPKDINSVKVGRDFFWASAMERDNMLNICMYEFPLQDDDGADGELELTLDSFMVHRNSFMKVNILGDKDDSYMTTNPMTVVGEVVVEDGVTVMQVRGLWRMENDFMGGPFVSYTWIDAETRKVFVAEGFVYAPQKKKRELIRELEASLRTVGR